MMKNNLVKLLSLALCLLFVCPAALAQESGYVIGKPARSLYADALGSGKIVTASAKLGLELDAEALGLSEEEAAQLLPLITALEQATITSGFGLIPEGVRLTLAGELADEDAGNAVGANAAVNITLDGLSLESDLIAGRRVTANWETLLTLAGLGEQEVALFATGKELVRSALDTGLEQLIQTYIASFGPMLEAYGQLVTPYLETVADFITTLPIELKENLNEEGYPPTATELCITVTQKDLGDLIQKLCLQLSNDEAALQYINVLLELAGETMSAGQLIDRVFLNARRHMTDTTFPVVLYLGMNEEGMPLYLEATVSDADSGESLYAGFFCYEDSEEGLIIDLSCALLGADGNPYVTFYAGGNHLGDSTDPNVHDLEFVVFAGEEDVTLLESTFSYTAVPAADSELPAYDLTNSYSMYIDDGYGGSHIVTSSQGRNGLTAAGGEFSTGTSQSDMYVQNSAMSVGAAVQTLVEPTADGGITGYYRLVESMPYVGVSNLTIDTLLGSETYDPAQTEALERLAIESMTDGDLDALAQEVLSTLLDDKLVTALTILPAEFTDMLLTMDAE